MPEDTFSHDAASMVPKRECYITGFYQRRPDTQKMRVSQYYIGGYPGNVTECSPPKAPNKVRMTRPEYSPPKVPNKNDNSNTPARVVPYLSLHF